MKESSSNWADFDFKVTNDGILVDIVRMVVAMCGSTVIRNLLCRIVCYPVTAEMTARFGKLFDDIVQALIFPK